jgi:hypothetical protein
MRGASSNAARAHVWLVLAGSRLGWVCTVAREPKLRNLGVHQ